VIISHSIPGRAVISDPSKSYSVFSGGGEWREMGMVVVEEIGRNGVEASKSDFHATYTKDYGVQ
jgi:hypothetical protein